MPYKRIYANIRELFDGAERLILDADVTAGSSTITVKNITGAAINQVLCFREPGSENAEIILTHGSTAPSGTTVTLVSTLVRSHPAGTVVYIIPYNQIRFYRSATEDDANTSDSGLTALAAASTINPTTIENYYDDATYTSGWYYYRFINSVTSVNSTYKGPISVGTFEATYDPDQVGYMLEQVKRKLGNDWDERFSKMAAIDEINACLRYIRGKLKKFGRYLTQNYVIGQTSPGVFEIALPADIYDTVTNKSILSVRLGTANYPITMVDEKEFDQIVGQAVRTTVRTQPSVGATSLNIVNSYDLPESGTVHIFTSTGDIDEITYTGVTRSATVGVLTGVPASGDGSISTAHAVGTNVWYGEQEGQPMFANVKDGYLRIYVLPDTEWINKNIVMDYYTGVTQVDSEEDSLDVDRYDMVKHWLLWQGKAYWRNNGKVDLKDEDFLIFERILKDMIRLAPTSQKHRMRPALNTISYKGRSTGNFDTE